MNKFNFLIAGLIVFVAVAQFALAGDGLTSELKEGEEVDDDLEGGVGGLLSSKAKKLVGVSTENEWGHDILDDHKGLSQFAQQRTQLCAKATNKEQCHTCCNGSGKASTFKLLSRVFKGKGCTCFDRDNSYVRRI